MLLAWQIKLKREKISLDWHWSDSWELWVGPNHCLYGCLCFKPCVVIVGHGPFMVILHREGPDGLDSTHLWLFSRLKWYHLKLFNDVYITGKIWVTPNFWTVVYFQSSKTWLLTSIILLYYTNRWISHMQKPSELMKKIQTLRCCKIPGLFL